MKKLLLVLVLVFLSGCSMKCGDVRRSVEAHPIKMIDPFIMTDLIIEGVVCGNDIY